MTNEGGDVQLSEDEESLSEMVAFVVANSGLTFDEVGDMNLPQFRAVQRALARKIKMTINPFMMLGAMTGVAGASTPAPGRDRRVELTPEQFEQVVRDRKLSLGKDALSLEEVFG